MVRWSLAAAGLPAVIRGLIRGRRPVGVETRVAVCSCGPCMLPVGRRAAPLVSSTPASCTAAAASAPPLLPRPPIRWALACLTREREKGTGSGGQAIKRGRTGLSGTCPPPQPDGRSRSRAGPLLPRLPCRIPLPFRVAAGRGTGFGFFPRPHALHDGRDDDR